MGITGAHELSHSVKGLSVQDVYNISSYIRKQKNIDTQPTIDLDASLIYRSSKLSIDNRMVQFIDICCHFSRAGFAVFVICDGAIRHHTKRATIQRQASLFSTKVKSYLLRVRLMSIAENKKATTDAAQSLALETEESNVSSQLKLCERKTIQSSVDVGQEFFKMIETHVKNIPSLDKGTKNGSITVLQAEFQADSLLAHRIVKNISDMVVSSDTDLLAHAGHKCLGIKIYNYVMKGKKSGIDNIEVFAADILMLQDIVAALRIKMTDKSVKITKYPIFEGVLSPKTRALLAVGLGCDVYKNGVRGVTKVLLRDWLYIATKNFMPTQQSSIRNFLYTSAIVILVTILVLKR